MLLEVLIVAGVSALAATLLQMVFTVAGTLSARQRFKRLSKGLPIANNFRWLGGHIHSAVFGDYSHAQLDQWHRLFGKTVGLMYGPQLLVSSIDLDLIKTFVVDEPNEHPNRIHLGLPVDELERDSIVFVEDEQWRRIRKAVAPAFTSHKFKAPNVMAEIEACVGKLVAAIEHRLDAAAAAARAGPPPPPPPQASGPETEAAPAPAKPVEIDAEDLCHRYTLDLVFSCLYKAYNKVDYLAPVEPYLKLVMAGVGDVLSPLTELSAIFPFLLPVVDKLVLYLHPLGRMRRNIRQFQDEFTRQNLEARRQMAAAERRAAPGHFDRDNFRLEDGSQFKRNMIDHIIDQWSEGKLTKTEYLHTSFFLFFAADKSSSDGISKVLYYLACNPHVQSKARAILADEGPDAEYLQWVLFESMRLSPPVLVGCSRTVTRDIPVKGGVVPKGTFVLTPTHIIHRLPEYWGPDADHFRPERWADAKSFHPCQFLAFGAGKRNCPGREFALFEMRMVLCALLKRYRFERSANTDDRMLYSAPFYIFTVAEQPTYINVSRL